MYQKLVQNRIYWLLLIGWFIFYEKLVHSPSLQSIAFSTNLISGKLSRIYQILAYISPYVLEYTRNKDPNN